MGAPVNQLGWLGIDQVRPWSRPAQFWRLGAGAALSRAA